MSIDLRSRMDNIDSSNTMTSIEPAHNGTYARLI
jgi:hypothetical protein